MYKPKNQEKQPEKELGGVMANFARDRFEAEVIGIGS
jgi:hypothetical protein